MKHWSQSLPQGTGEHREVVIVDDDHRCVVCVEIEALCEMACGSLRLPPMELLDWFAGQAMPVMLRVNQRNADALASAMGVNLADLDQEQLAEVSRRTLSNSAEASYDMADAMLAERARRTTEPDAVNP